MKYITFVLLLCAFVFACSPQRSTQSKTPQQTQQQTATTQPEKASSQSQQTDEPGEPGFSQSVLSNNGTYIVTYETDPDDYPLNKYFTINVRLLDAATREPIGNNAELEVDARMPEHFHGMVTQPQVTENPNGTFTVEGMLFHMSGYWELYFDIIRNSRAERAQVPIELE